MFFLLRLIYLYKLRLYIYQIIIDNKYLCRNDVLNDIESELSQKEADSENNSDEESHISVIN